MPVQAVEMTSATPSQATPAIFFSSLHLWASQSQIAQLFTHAQKLAHFSLTPSQTLPAHSLKPFHLSASHCHRPQLFTQFQKPFHFSLTLSHRLPAPCFIHSQKPARVGFTSSSCAPMSGISGTLVSGTPSRVSPSPVSPSPAPLILLARSPA